MMVKKYKKVKKRDLKKYFTLQDQFNTFSINLSSRTKPALIKLPFYLDEDVARLVGLIPDGCITSNLMRIFFHQKKDLRNMRILLQTIEITSHITFTPRPYATSGQYRVSIYRKENFLRFKEIGFRIPFLHERFNQLCKNYVI